MTEAEFLKFEMEAASRSVTHSKLARAVIAAHLAKQRVQLPHAQGMRTEALRELARIGNNLNQLARQANVGLVTVPEPELRACLAALNSFASRL